LPHYTFSLRITPEQYQAYYTGRIKQVVVKTEQGNTLRFPIHHLRPFVTYEGVSGRFAMELDDQHRLTQMTRL
jgi:hypothetical protein